MKNYYQNKFGFLSVVLFFVFFIFLFIYLTSPFGLGFSSDSANYVLLARELEKIGKINKDLLILNTHWPWGYPFIIMITKKIFHINDFQSVYVINVVSLGLILLLWYKLLRFFHFDYKEIILISLVWFVSYPFYPFKMAWSEIPFLLFLFLSIYFFLVWLKNHSKITILFSGVFMAVSFSIRYAAAGFIAGFILFMILYLYKFNEIKRKYIYPVLFLLPISLYYLFWKFITAYFGLGTSDRVFHFVPVLPRKIYTLFRNVTFWFLDRYAYHDKNYLALLPSLFLLLMILIVIIKQVQITRVKNIMRNNNYVLFLIWISTFYLFFLFFSISFFDSGTPLDARILFPVVPLVLIVFFFIYKNSIQTKKINYYAVYILLSIVFIQVSFPGWKKHFFAGSGFTNQNTRHIIEEFSNHYNTAGISYSNYPEIIQLYFPHKRSYFVSKKRNVMVNYRSKIQTLNDPVNEMKKNVCEKNAVIFYFKNQVRAYTMNDTQLLKLFSKHDQCRIINNDNYLIIEKH